MGNISQVVDGLEIFRRHLPKIWISAEHDMIYGPYIHDLVLSEEELEQLDMLGWRIDPDNNCWAMGV